MIIPRLQYTILKESIQPGKVVILYGPRRVGKTTLLTELAGELPGRMIKFNGDNISDQETLAFHDERHLKGIVGDAQTIIVDEAQRIENIGLSLKIIVDTLPQVAVVASGSAALGLAKHTEEPLTGRKKVVTLYPLSFPELSNYLGKYEAKVQLARWLIWGGYPEVVLTENRNERGNYLKELVGSYLYRDILELEEVRRSGKIVDLLRLLAFQIGHEVSTSELARNLSLNRETVVRYLDLLEQVFVIFNVRGFARNLRKEIAKSSRYYFWDNGVRNALIDNFNDLGIRNDKGMLWENFLAIERLKYMAHKGEMTPYYFWRTYDKKEIDWIEESGGSLRGFEFKMKGRIKAVTTREFQATYPNSRLYTVTMDNFDRFFNDLK